MVRKTYDRKQVGQRIQQYRKTIGLTQKEMAAKVGRAYKYYQDIERGSCGMSLETMLDIASFLNISLDILIYGKESERLEG